MGAFRRPSERNPEPPTGGEAVTALLCAGFAFELYSLLYLICLIILGRSIKCNNNFILKQYVENERRILIE